MSAVVAPTALDRLWNSFRALVRAEFPTFTFTGIYEYAIQNTRGSIPNVTVDCTPTDTTIPLPPLTNIPLRSSVSGATSVPNVGTRCIVAFLNQDPTRPVIVGVDAVVSRASVDATSEVDIGPSSGSVNLGPSPGTMALGASTESAVAALLSWAQGVASAATGNPVVYSAFASAINSAASNTVLAPAVTNTPLIPSTVVKGS